MQLNRFLLAAVTVAFFCGAAQAQFVGDVFAKVPSIAAPAGGQAAVEVQLFSGVTVFGASIVQVTFQEGQLAVREVLLPGDSGHRRISVDRRTKGKVEFATFNIEATARQVGTVPLAVVVFDVLGTPGTVARYTMTPREIVSQSEARYPRTGGAVGEVVVVSASGARTLAPAAVETPNSTSPGTPSVATDRESIDRAAALRPRGGAVDLVVPVQRGTHVSAQIVRVQPQVSRVEE